jgi:flagellin
MAITAFNELSARALRGLENAQKIFDTATERLATGLRVQRAGDDPGAFSMATRLQARALSIVRTQISVQTDQSLVQTASDGISKILDALKTIRSLALASASSTATTADRKANEIQAQDLIAEINRISANTFFNGKSLLNGDFKVGKATLIFQVGPDAGTENRITLNIRTLSAAALGVDDVTVSTQSGALGALDDIDSAITVATSEDANVGGKANRLASAEDFLGDQLLSHNTAISSLVDANLAEEAINQARGALLRDTATSALAQANLFPSNVLRVLLPGLSAS